METQTVEKLELKHLAEWQPIDTAPKNFSDVLIYLPRSEFGDYGERVTVAFWEVDLRLWIIPGLLPNEESNPTHWMPLPEPPIAN